jgi:hypothetical protein
MTRDIPERESLTVAVGRIKRGDVAALFQISDDQARRLLRKSASEKTSSPHGSGRDTWSGPA